MVSLFLKSLGVFYFLVFQFVWVFVEGKIDVGAYYFPAWHSDPRVVPFHGSPWSEWNLIQNAKPRFPGHQQPKVPQWGYANESDPAVMQLKINAAQKYGVDFFIFDWYFYEGSEYLSGPLQNAFLTADNNQTKFALMWANHQWTNMFPASYYDKVYNDHYDTPGALLFNTCLTTPAIFQNTTVPAIIKYFMHPQYYKINGQPFFSLYDVGQMYQCWNQNITVVLENLNYLRAMTVKAGFPDLHLNFIDWGARELPNYVQELQQLKAGSVTSYCWVHNVGLPSFPVSDFMYMFNQTQVYWQSARTTYGSIPYIPNVSAGWDPSPRTSQSDNYDNLGYPFTATFNSTQSQFQEALLAAQKFVQSAPPNTPQIVTINAWNEWTEGSYLEPDEAEGFAKLEAIQSVFGAR